MSPGQSDGRPFFRLRYIVGRYTLEWSLDVLVAWVVVRRPQIAALPDPGEIGHEIEGAREATARVAGLSVIVFAVASLA